MGWCQWLPSPLSNGAFSGTPGDVLSVRDARKPVVPASLIAGHSAFVTLLGWQLRGRIHCAFRLIFWVPS